MNPLPDLPLIDGCFLIDNSTLEKFQNCRREYELSGLRRYSLQASRAGRNFGSGMHVGMKTRYTLAGTSKPSPEIVTKINDDMMAFFESSPEPLGDFRNASHACRMMAEYNKVHGAEPFRILSHPKDGHPLVEQSFALELGHVQNVPIIWTGRMDMLIEASDGIFSFDHKNVFMFGKTWEDEMRVNGGQRGYVWAGRQILGRKVHGFIINGIRVRKPGISRASKAVAYAENLSVEPVAPVDAEDFRRLPFYVTDDDIEEWKRDTLALISDLFFCHDRGYFPMSRKACVGKYGACDFYEVCTSQQHARQGILESSMYGPNNWSPLNPTNQPA